MLRDRVSNILCFYMRFGGIITNATFSLFSTSAMVLTLLKSKKVRGQWSVGGVNMPVAVQSWLKS